MKRVRSHLCLIVVIVVGLTLLGGCRRLLSPFFSEREGHTAIRVDQPEQSHTFVVDSHGGRLEIDDPGSSLHGIVLDVPPGAFGDGATLTVSQGTESPGLPPTAYAVTKPVRIVYGEGSLMEHVDVTLPTATPPGRYESLVAVVWSDKTGLWDIAPIVALTPDAITVRMHHLSTVVVECHEIDWSAPVDQVGFTDQMTYPIDNFELNTFLNLGPPGVCFGITTFVKWFYSQKMPLRLRDDAYMIGAAESIAENVTLSIQGLASNLLFGWPDATENPALATATSLYRGLQLQSPQILKVWLTYDTEPPPDTDDFKPPPDLRHFIIIHAWDGEKFRAYDPNDNTTVDDYWLAFDGTSFTDSSAPAPDRYRVIGHVGTNWAFNKSGEEYERVGGSLGSAFNDMRIETHHTAADDTTQIWFRAYCKANVSSVSVSGPPDSGIVGYELYDDGRHIDLEPNDGVFSNYTRTPARIEIGDVYEFTAAMPYSTVTEARRVTSVNRSPATGITISGAAEDRRVVWNPAPNATFQIVAITNGYQLHNPAPGMWLASWTLDGASSEVDLGEQITFGVGVEYGVYVMSYDAASSVSWNGIAFTEASQIVALNVESNIGELGVAVSPDDGNSLGNGQTPFSRSYINGTEVTVSVSSSVVGAPFDHWQRNGVQVSTSPTYTLTMDDDYDLTAVYRRLMIVSGRVTAAGGAGVPDVVIEFSGDGGSAVTDEHGYYSRAVQYGYTGTATPSKEGYTFTPASRSYTSVTEDQSGQGYTAISAPDPVTISMTPVPGGTFQRDGTATNITTVSGFSMSTYPITQAQYVAVTGKPNPSYFPHGDNAPNRPVEVVNWYDALVFCNMLSMAEGRTPVYAISGSTNPADWGTVPSHLNNSSETEWDAVTMNIAANGYRLPTEAEWMWAAMGATSGHGYPGSGVYTTGWLKAFAGSTGSNSIDDYAWYGHHSSPQGTATEETTYPVGSKLPNELGLYDMSGNVSEWTWDRWWWYPSGSLTNPTGPVSGAARVLRGGGWDYGASSCTLAGRTVNHPTTLNISNGFRVVSR